MRSWKRMRSPRMAPPVKGLVGSTAMTPTVLLASRNARARRSTRVLLPAPGEPVMPMRRALPVWGKQAESTAADSGASFSMRGIARGGARGSPWRGGGTGGETELGVAAFFQRPVSGGRVACVDEVVDLDGGGAEVFEEAGHDLFVVCT